MRFTPGPLSREELIRLSERDVAVLWSVIPDHVCVLGALVTGLSLERVRRLLGIESFGDRAALAERAVVADRGQLRVNEVDHTGLSLVGVNDDASPAALWRASVMDLVAAGSDGLQAEEMVWLARLDWPETTEVQS